MLAGAKTGAGMAKDLGGFLTIVDALTGRSKQITNSEQVPPGWYVQGEGPVTTQTPAPLDAAPAPAGAGGIAVIGVGLLAVLALLGR